MLGTIEQLIIERAAAGTSMAARLERWAKEQGVSVVHRSSGREHTAPDLGIATSKRSLLLVRHQGAVLKPCTGRTDSLLCCDLHVITQTVGCPLDCSYCVLQHYQNRAQITLRADPEEILDRLEQELAQKPHRLFRVCTGQVADSLALEPVVGFAAPAVERFAALPNGVLELKTKTDRVDFLLGLAHGGRTVISWSLNPPQVVEQEEHGCAPLGARLEAARQAAGAGYLVAFHLDPMICSRPGDEQRYVDLAREATAAIPADRLAYLSMGTVRFLPSMRRTLAARFALSRVTHGELLPDVDGKLRLLSPLRTALYRNLAQAIRQRCPDTFIYLCMEPARIWRQALDAPWTSQQEVDLAFSASLQRRYGLGPECER